MIIIKKEGQRFNYRVAGIAIKDKKVLLHRPEEDDFWTLPGGRCELMEPSTETLRREFLEELGERVTVNKLYWVVENFFESGEEKTHEISMYYKINFEEGSRIFSSSEIKGTEEDKNLIFKWFDIKDLENIPIQPLFIKLELNNLSDEINHIVNNEII